MKTWSRKIFWGILVASIHVKLFEMILFPSCFGFVIVYLGIHDMEKYGGHGRKNLRFLRTSAAALVLVSALSDYLSVVPYFDTGGIWQMLPAILEYTVLYYLLDLYSELRPQTSGLRRAYALVMGGAVCGYGLSLMFASGGWQIFCVIVMTVSRILVLKAAYA